MSSPIVSLQNHPTSFWPGVLICFHVFSVANIKLQPGYPPGFQLKQWKSGTLEHLVFFFFLGGGKNPLPLVDHLVCNLLFSGLAMTTCSAVVGSYLTDKHRIMSPSLINVCEKPMSVCTNCPWNQFPGAICPKMPQFPHPQPDHECTVNEDAGQMRDQMRYYFRIS